MLWANTLYKTKNKLLLIVAVAVLAMPVATLFSSQTAFAADAVWKNDTTISYGGNDYTKGGSVIGKDWTLYSGKKDSHNCSSAIYFEKGVDIDNATSAKFWPGTYVRGAMGSGHCDHGDAKTISLKPLKSGTGTTDGEGGGKDEPDVNCDAGSWTFMVCPFITSTQTVLKKLFEMIADLSYFQPLPIGAPQKGAEWAIYYGWSTFLTFANIAAVIGFLVIIFSQATSIGLSSYGVKKLLPKMILVMLLMNVSYYLCAIAIDISNIIGAAINDIFNYIYSRVTNKLDPTAVNGGFGSGAVMGWFGGAVELAIIVAFFLVPVLITLLVIFGVLAARIAILTLLVIIAPLAFAAWILPNTEKYFKKWWSLFFDMLALYPVLMAVYGGATLAANILMLSAQQSDYTFNNILPFVALLIQVIPLLAVPFIIKGTSGTLGKIGSMVESKSRKPAEWAGGKAKNYARFGAVAGGRAAGRGINKAGTKIGFIDPNKPGVVSKSAKRVRSGYKNMRAFDKAVDTSLEARKRGREEEIGERASEIGVGSGVAGKALSGVGGSRYDEIVAAQVDKAHKERIQANRAFLQGQGISSDRKALTAKILDPTTDAAMAGAASDLLLETAGTEEYGQILRSSAMKGRKEVAKAVLDAGKRQYGTVDSKSPDVADFLGQANALDQIVAGNAMTEVKGQGRSIGLPAEKMIKFEPNQMARLFEKASKLNPANAADAARLTQLTEQAKIAQTSVNFGSAKAETQEAINALAAGTYNPAAVPSVSKNLSNDNTLGKI